MLKRVRNSVANLILTLVLAWPSSAVAHVKWFVRADSEHQLAEPGGIGKLVL